MPVGAAPIHIFILDFTLDWPKRAARRDEKLGGLYQRFNGIDDYYSSIPSSNPVHLEHLGLALSTNNTEFDSGVISYPCLYLENNPLYVQCCLLKHVRLLNIDFFYSIPPLSPVTIQVED